MRELTISSSDLFLPLGYPPQPNHVPIQINKEVRTLFVSGLPMDTKPREIYLMFRGFKGYQSSLLKLTGKEGKKATPVAFVTFETREQAETTKSELQGVRFDPELATTIRIEFAKANTKVSNPVLKPATATSMVLPGIPSPTFPANAFDLAAAGLFAHADPTNWPTSTANFTDLNGNHLTALPQQHLHPGLTTLPLGTAPFMAVPHSAFDRLATLSCSLPLTAPVSIANQGHHLIHNPILNNVAASDAANACTTLFVANLGSGTTEDELKASFCRFPTFRRIKMLRNKNTAPVAFVEYGEVLYALHAKTYFQGGLLPSSENGGMRIEFAKNKMGETGKRMDGQPEIIAQ
ncbi:uncharacterized protein [Clytia hemisphaerica]|uniref:uncharacterized protein isoform X7 n=1 Tax=Clytia hemisphaerica TaxID=252671 RepID=UPI0034D6607C